MLEADLDALRRFLVEFIGTQKPVVFPIAPAKRLSSAKIEAFGAFSRPTHLLSNHQCLAPKFDAPALY